MTSDLIQNIMIANKTRRSGKGVDITREQGFLDGSHDIFDLLDRNQKPDLALPLPKNVTDLLRAAYSAIENAEKTISNQNQRIQILESLLTTDELTGLCNRRGFMAALAAETDRTNRGLSQGGLLIMIDLDQFKLINDTYGHAAGDEALRKTSDYLKSQVRDMDTAARLGGDEFVILFPNTNKTKAFKRAQGIRHGLNNLSFEYNGKTIPIRGSLGLKDYNIGSVLSDVLLGADANLYHDKELRKNSAPSKKE